MPSRWSAAHTLALLVIAAAFAYLSCTAKAHITPVGIWGACMALIIGFIATLGHGITGNWRGAFIDERNVISLSRFQMLAWTILILSAYLAATLWNLAQDPSLGVIELDEQLWMLMGISTTSLVASPLILNGKKDKTPDAAQMNHTFELLQKAGDDALKNKGLIVANQNIRQARWSDMLTGEETGNAAHIDLSRLQMFFFTLIGLIIYALALAQLFHTTAAIDAFPPLSNGLVALIGISHTGYLGVKAVPQSQAIGTDSAPPQEPDKPASEQPAVG